MSPVNPATNTPKRAQEWRSELRLGTTLQRITGRCHLGGGPCHWWGDAAGGQGDLGRILAGAGAGVGVVDHVRDHHRGHGGQSVLQRERWVRAVQVVLVPAHSHVLDCHLHVCCGTAARQKHRGVFACVGVCRSRGVDVSLFVGVVSAAGIECVQH
jgi:hypothetical protein